MKEEELKCTYRSPANFFSLMIAIVFLAGAIWATVKLRDSKMGVVIIAAFLCTMYFVLSMLSIGNWAIKLSVCATLLSWRSPMVNCSISLAK